MGTDTLISVVVPTFNDSSERLKKTLKSVLGQTYSNLEVIVADDGSKVPFDGLENALQDSRLRWLKTQHNGVASTRNAAAKESKGSYLAFLDSGDWWEPTKLEKQLDLIQANPQIKMVYCSARTHDPFERTADIIASKQGNLYRDLLVSQPVVGSCSAVLIPKGLFTELGGFYDQRDIPEDQEMWLRVAKEGEISYVDEVLVHLEINLSSRSADPVAKMLPYSEFIAMHEEEIKREGLYRLAWSNYHVAIADKFFSASYFLPGMRHIISSLAFLPTRKAVFRFFAGFLAIFGSSAYLYVKHLYRKKAEIQ